MSNHMQVPVQTPPQQERTSGVCHGVSAVATASGCVHNVQCSRVGDSECVITPAHRHEVNSRQVPEQAVDNGWYITSVVLFLVTMHPACVYTYRLRMPQGRSANILQVLVAAKRRAGRTGTSTQHQDGVHTIKGGRATCGPFINSWSLVQWRPDADLLRCIRGAPSGWGQCYGGDSTTWN
jgi:hypothetical protein